MIADANGNCLSILGDYRGLGSKTRTATWVRFNGDAIQLTQFRRRQTGGGTAARIHRRDESLASTPHPTCLPSAHPNLPPRRDENNAGSLRCIAPELGLYILYIDPLIMDVPRIVRAIARIWPPFPLRLRFNRRYFAFTASLSLSLVSRGRDEVRVRSARSNDVDVRIVRQPFRIRVTSRSRAARHEYRADARLRILRGSATLACIFVVS